MLPIAFLVTWAGYGVFSWGYNIHRGWNVGFGEWFNPVHVYDWPAGDPPLIPATQVNPSASAKPGPQPPAQAA